MPLFSLFVAFESEPYLFYLLVNFLFIFFSSRFFSVCLFCFETGSYAAQAGLKLTA